MSHDASTGLLMVRRRIAELDALAKQTLHDLSTVARTERVAKWKAHTAALIVNTVSPQEGQKFASTQPGPLFTNDMVEKFTDRIDCYRAPLATLAKRLDQASPHVS